MRLVSRQSSQRPKRSPARADAPLKVRASHEKKPGSFERHIHGFVAMTLGREIVGGVYPPGSLLPNTAELSERFGVSRTVLREAYSLLTAKALIVARPKIGTRVRPKSEWHMFDPDLLAWHLEAGQGLAFVSNLFVLRQMVEPAAAALAADCRSDETVKQIAEAFSRMERFRDGGGGLIDADLDFHMAILSATGNPFLAGLGGFIHAALQETFRLTWEGAERMHSDRLRQHGLILAAIRQGSPELARRRMSALLRDSLKDASRAPAKAK
jgi:GntR family transcriptional regulator, galactonate operon transcriptional repressor